MLEGFEGMALAVALGGHVTAGAGTRTGSAADFVMNVCGTGIAQAWVFKCQPGLSGIHDTSSRGMMSCES